MYSDEQRNFVEFFVAVAITNKKWQKVRDGPLKIDTSQCCYIVSTLKVIILMYD